MSHPMTESFSPILRMPEENAYDICDASGRPGVGHPLLPSLSMSSPSGRGRPSRDGRVRAARRPKRQTPAMPQPPARRRSLRRRSTAAEQRLWYLLKNRQLGNAKFRRQHAIGPYIADFYCHQHRLVIEVDGGGHATARRLDHDCQRTAYFERLSLRVLRFWGNEVLQNPEGVWEAVEQTVLPHPNPLPGGEGKSTSAVPRHRSWSSKTGVHVERAR